MGIKAYLQDKAGNLLGASWAAPIRVALHGRGAGDFHSPYDFTATRSGDNQLTLTGSGLPTITDSSQFRAVRAYDVTGRLVAEFYNSGRTGFYWDSLGAVLTVGGVKFSPAASSFEVELQGQHRGYSATETSWQSYQVNPEHAWTQQSTPVDDTNITDGTVYYYVDFDQYRYAGYQISLDCDAATVTATLEASLQDDGTAQGSCAYQDVTNDLFGVASLVAAAAPASDMWVIDTPFPAKFLRLKIVYATGGNTGDATVYFRGTY